MEFAEILKLVVEIGITPVLLALFIWYFFQSAKQRDAQLNSVYENFEKKENILISEGARREELLRQESEKREKLMRQEAEKRENALMSTIERYSHTMEKISDTMKQIEVSHVQVLNKVNGIESNLEKWWGENGQARNIKS